MGGAHTVSYITVKEDGSDRYDPENVQHKYSKVPALLGKGYLLFVRRSFENPFLCDTLRT